MVRGSMLRVIGNNFNDNATNRIDVEKVGFVVMSVIMLLAVSVSCFVVPYIGRTVSDVDMVEEIYYDRARCVVVDCGHGGVDPGKTGFGGIVEKDINLKIGMKLRQRLVDEGYRVVMTRTSDEGLYEQSDSNKKRADLRRRCELIEASCADAVISIHQNSFSDERVRGAQVFYYRHSEDGKKLAGLLQGSLADCVDSSNKRVEKADSSYYMLVNTAVPSVIVECGFLSNRAEGKLLSSDGYQERIVEALVMGINKYFDL